MVRFKFLSGDVNWKEYGGKFVSQELNNGDWPYYLILDVINMHEATGEENQDKYVVEIHAISPMAVKETNPKELESAFSSMGFSDDQMKEFENNVLIQVEMLNDYGILAMLKSFSGNNINKLLKQAKKECQMIEFLFGFYMDRQENLIGSTGWDCISGDLMRPIREYKE